MTNTERLRNRVVRLERAREALLNAGPASQSEADIEAHLERAGELREQAEQAYDEYCEALGVYLVRFEELREGGQS